MEKKLVCNLGDCLLRSLRETRGKAEALGYTFAWIHVLSRLVPHLPDDSEVSG